MANPSQEFFDRAYDLKERALQASADNAVVKGRLIKKHKRAANWTASEEALGDVTRLRDTRLYLGNRALGSGRTALYISSYEGVEDEYLIEFKEQKVHMLLAVSGYSIKGRIAENSGRVHEARLGFNEFEEDRQNLVLTELERGASGLYVCEAPGRAV